MGVGRHRQTIHGPIYELRRVPGRKSAVLFYDPTHLPWALVAVTFPGRTSAECCRKWYEVEDERFRLEWTRQSSLCKYSSISTCLPSADAFRNQRCSQAVNPSPTTFRLGPIAGFFIQLKPANQSPHIPHTRYITSSARQSRPVGPRATRSRSLRRPAQPRSPDPIVEREAGREAIASRAGAPRIAMAVAFEDFQRSVAARQHGRRPQSADGRCVQIAVQSRVLQDPRQKASFHIH